MGRRARYNPECNMPQSRCKTAAEWKAMGEKEGRNDRYFFEEDEENDVERYRRRKRQEITERILNSAMTERQKQCCVLYFSYGMKMPAIAEQLGLDKSTVSRHIRAGKRKVERLMALYSGKGRV
ncbi:MAG: sigma factor-like helix-turn-helix DNA-binding protein [Clostridia bacterium]|nr:sigma factor-like helix-turn-helix DNA-binding protein [Clostridia bacterium]